jgi:hypothetical protein
MVFVEAVGCIVNRINDHEPRGHRLGGDDDAP